MAEAPFNPDFLNTIVNINFNSAYMMVIAEFVGPRLESNPCTIEMDFTSFAGGTPGFINDLKSGPSSKITHNVAGDPVDYVLVPEDLSSKTNTAAGAPMDGICVAGADSDNDPFQAIWLVSLGSPLPSNAFTAHLYSTFQDIGGATPGVIAQVGTLKSIKAGVSLGALTSQFVSSVSLSSTPGDSKLITINPLTLRVS